MKDPLEEAGVGADVNSRVATGILLTFIAAMVALAIFVPGSRTPLLLIVGIILMVMLHEFGHYWMAKRSGMKVTEFFVGFGPRLWSFTRGETEYGVKAIPAGGYVRIIGMTNLEEVDPADEPRTFRQATPGQAPRHHPRRRHRQLLHRLRAVLRGDRRAGPRRRRPEHHRRARRRRQRRARGRAPDRRQGRRRQRQAGRQLGRPQVGHRAQRRQRDQPSPCCATAATVTLTATPKHAGRPGLPRRRSRHRRARRRRARGGARVVQDDGQRVHRLRRTSSATGSRRRA